MKSKPSAASQTRNDAKTQGKFAVALTPPSPVPASASSSMTKSQVSGSSFATSESSRTVTTAHQLSGESSDRSPTGSPLPISTSSKRSIALSKLYGEDEHFEALVRSVNEAIKAGIHPELIADGSSGSYYAFNSARERVAVFKPHDEEPYGDLNPKYLKYLQRILSPCCFGRSCISPNEGYLAEAGAYLVDKHFGLGVVPRTRVVTLASPAFNYSRKHISKAKNGKPLAKTGSFQEYIPGCEKLTAEKWIDKYFASLQPQAVESLLNAFQRMVALDYIIRNTDRAGNWLIKYTGLPLDDEKPSTAAVVSVTGGAAASASSAVVTTGSSTAEEGSNENFEVAETQSLLERSTSSDEEGELDIVSVVAIDNGLAFPFKHPSKMRAYPFSWAKQQQLAGQPFSKAICDFLLPKLRDANFIEQMCGDLRVLFSASSVARKRKKAFENQLSVVRGQISNLIDALEKRTSPAELAAMKPVLLRNKRRRHRRGKFGASSGNYERALPKREPCLTCC